MDQKIVLDEQSFKALSADSRVSILKSLGERRRTLSELSQKLTLGNSTVKEHCDILVNAQLIKQVDEGRKWKYYELTNKGKQIITPNLMEEVKVLIVLCIGVIMVGAITFFSFQLFPAGSAQTPLANDTFGAQVLSKSSAINEADQTLTANATAGAVSSLRTDANAAPELICGSAQCSISNAGEITKEFFLMSTMISIIFGIVLGWAVTRTKAQ